jgi:GTP-binding protein EngB required for normal cell division
MIVDSPGYGYIKAPEHLKAKWKNMILKYLSN